MNRINPAKLLNSKWTALQPQKREKHFFVSDVDYAEDGSVRSCTLEAVMTHVEYSIDWKELKNTDKWAYGWK